MSCARDDRATHRRRRSGRTSSSAPTRADLPLWEELARPERRAGARARRGRGPGRPPPRRGRGTEVIAVDRDPELAAELERRAERDGVPRHRPRRRRSTVPGLDLPPPAARDRAAARCSSSSGADASGMLCSRRWRELLAPGGRCSRRPWSTSRPSSTRAWRRAGSSPTCARSDGWVYSSEPLWVQVAERTMRVARLRERVSPDGEIERSGPRRAPRARLARSSSRRRRRRPGLRPSGAAADPGRADARPTRSSSSLEAPMSARPTSSFACSRSTPSR